MIRNLLLGLSGTAIGTALFISLERALAARYDRMQMFYAMASGGFAGAVFLIAKAVFRSPMIPISGDAVWYAISLTAASVGYIGIAIDQRNQSNRRSSDR